MAAATDGRSLGLRLWWLGAAQFFHAFSISVFTLGIVFAGAQAGDATGLGLVLGARTLPVILIALVGGVVADRWSRSTVAALSLFGVAVCHAAAALLLPLVGLGFALQAAAFAAGLAGAFGAPSLYALLPSLVPHELIVRANAVVRTARNSAAVVGPALAALLFERLGITAVMMGSVVPTIVAAIILYRLKVRAVPLSRESIRGDLLGSLPVLSAHRWLAITIPFWAVFLALQSGGADVSQPLRVIAESGAPAWSAIVAATAVGYILGGVFSYRFQLSDWALTGSVAFAVVAPVQLSLVGSTDTLLVWVPTALAAGFGLEVSGVLWGAALQSRVPSPVLGKVSSLDYAVSFGFIPFAYAVFGLVSGSVVSHEWVLIGTGAVLGALVLVLLPVYVRLDRRAQSNTGADEETGSRNS